MKNSPNSFEQPEISVIDGGALLYQVAWLPDSTYKYVAKQYTEHILSNYGESEKIFVMFDGYDDHFQPRQLHTFTGVIFALHTWILEILEGAVGSFWAGLLRDCGIGR